MIKKEIYPKTERHKIEGIKVQITEKLDGSNLCFFKIDNELYIATRKNIFTLTEVLTNYSSIKDIIYPYLDNWLKENGSNLRDCLNNNSVICGEWLAMGKLKYPDLDNRFYMYAKANIYEEMILENIKYDHNLFIYPFTNQNIPSFIKFVPLVEEVNFFPNVDYLNELYGKYTTLVNRAVEGFVVNFDDRITKYVRMKNGKLADHYDQFKY